MVFLARIALKPVQPSQAGRTFSFKLLILARNIYNKRQLSWLKSAARIFFSIEDLTWWRDDNGRSWTRTGAHEVLVFVDAEPPALEEPGTLAQPELLLLVNLKANTERFR